MLKDFTLNFTTATTWADMPNWPQMNSGTQPVLPVNNSEEKSNDASTTESPDSG